MSRPATATVTVLTLPHIAPDAVRIEIACSGSTTGVIHVPAPTLAMDTPMLVTMAVFEHEARCGQCSTEQAHQQGDQTILEATECAWNEIRAAFGRRYADGRRN